MWLNALLAAVGEQFAEGDEVCGVVVNVRPKQVREYFSPSSLSLSLSLFFQPPPPSTDSFSPSTSYSFSSLTSLLLLSSSLLPPPSSSSFKKNPKLKQDKVCLWTRTASDEAAQVSVGKQLKALLDLDSSARVGFMSHSDAKSMGRGVKERYIV